MKAFIWIIIVIVVLYIWGALEPKPPTLIYYDNGGTCDYGKPCETVEYVDDSVDPDGYPDYGWLYTR